MDTTEQKLKALEKEVVSLQQCVALVFLWVLGLTFVLAVMLGALIV